jgi:hypothetical protein
MKKRIFLLAFMIFSGVIFISHTDNKLKACGTNSDAAPAASNKKCKMLKMQNEYADDQDAFLGIFMNPFQH